MFFISNFIYAAICSLPIVMFAPIDTNYREIRESKHFTVGILGAEYRPNIIESLSGAVGLGINWDPWYLSFDSDSLNAEKIDTYASQDPYIEVNKAHKISFYASYYLQEESSFYINFISNIVRVPFEYKIKSMDVYANSQDRTLMKFTTTYISYGVGIGWHCIWESGLSILAGIDFSITATSFSSVDSRQDGLSSKTKDLLLTQYEDEHLFPFSSKFMLGYSF